MGFKINKKPIIIAEVAQGYNGDKNLCKFLIKKASLIGVKYLKFQLVFADELAIPKYKYYKLFKSLEMPYNSWKEIISFSDKLNVQICFDIFGSKSLKYSNELGVKIIKIHSTDLNNTNLLKKINKLEEKKVILSVGGGTSSEIIKSLKYLDNVKDLVVQVGFQGYPTKLSENQLNRIIYISNLLKEKKVSFSFADHHDGSLNETIAISSAAFSLGYSVFEKHFTVDKKMKLEDSESALDLYEFKSYIQSINILPKLYNSKNSEFFGMSNNEKNYRINVRKDFVSSRNIKKNKILKLSDISLKRTNSATDFDSIDDILGKKLTRNLKKDTKLLNKYLKKNEK